MRGADDLPALSRYTFGTMSLGRNPACMEEDVSVARAAMDAGVWFHTSREYGGGGTFSVLRRAFDADRPHVPRCLFKIRCDTADSIRSDVEDACRRLALERLDIAQLCRDVHDKRQIVNDFLAEGPMWRTCRELKEDGRVGNFVMEVFATFSADALRAVQNHMFDGYILYYSLLDRQMTNELYDVAQAEQVPLLAMRVLCGGLLDIDRARQASAKRPGAPELARRKMLAPLFERSGCTTWQEFGLRFILSVPGVRTAVGGTRNREHLETYLRTARSFVPLDAGLVSQVLALHRDWFAPCV